MKTIRVIFARNKKPICLLIRLVPWSRWSHCAVLDGEFVIEAKGKRRYKIAESVINFIFLPFEKDHCRNSIEWDRL